MYVGFRNSSNVYIHHVCICNALFLPLYVQYLFLQCLLMESYYREVIQLHMSSRTELLGISLMTTIPYCNGTGVSSTRAPAVKSVLEVVMPSAPPEYVPEKNTYRKCVILAMIVFVKL